MRRVVDTHHKEPRRNASYRRRRRRGLLLVCAIAHPFQRRRGGLWEGPFACGLHGFSACLSLFFSGEEQQTWENQSEEQPLVPSAPVDAGRDGDALEAGPVRGESGGRGVGGQGLSVVVTGHSTDVLSQDKSSQWTAWRAGSVGRPTGAAKQAR